MKTQIDADRLTAVISSILTDRHDRRIKARMESKYEKGSKDYNGNCGAPDYGGRVSA